MFKKKKVEEKCDCKLLQEKATELEEILKRTQADFVNYKKRSEGEKKQILNLAKAEVVLSFLPLYDVLLRAEKMSNETAEGMKKIIQMFETILNNYEIKKIEIDENVFDPALAEAIGFKDGTKEQNGKIAEVVETGFKIGDQTIRPAKVLIYK